MQNQRKTHLERHYAQPRNREHNNHGRSTMDGKIEMIREDKSASD
jgi:hypothetical protein